MSLCTPTFTAWEVREILRNADLPEDLSEANIAQIGLTVIKTQRELVISSYFGNPSVDAIWRSLACVVPKSSIRAYLSRAEAAGEIGGEWREGRGRRRVTP